MVVVAVKEALLQDEHGDDVNYIYKMVLVVATCKTDFANFILASFYLHPDDVEHTANFCFHREDEENIAIFSLDVEHIANFSLAICLCPKDAEHIANFSLAICLCPEGAEPTSACTWRMWRTLSTSAWM